MPGKGTEGVSGPPRPEHLAQGFLDVTVISLAQIE